MRRTVSLLAAILLVATIAVTGWAAEVVNPDNLPTPELNRTSVQVLPPTPCVADEGNLYEADQYAQEGWGAGGRYPGACRRLRFVFGPILVKPGQNDVLLTLTSEKPAYDGYAIRRKPDLINARGIIPPVEQLHLHHGTWLWGGNSSSFASSPYGKGPFWASGEEKTIGLFPQGYGVEIKGTDPWIFLFMVHSGIATPDVVYVIDTIDFVEKAAAEDAARWAPNPAIKGTKNLWLDVGRGGWHPDARPYSYNPVFNIQRGFGHVDTGSFWKPGSGPGFTVDADQTRTVCYFPRENCARFNSAGKIAAQQGYDAALNPPTGISPRPVNGDDVLIDEDILGTHNEGTIVIMGGHVHPGGIRDEVSLVRGATCNTQKRDCTGGIEKPIHISDAVYWGGSDYTNPALAGAPPISWDLAMTGTGIQTGWRVRVKKGDVLRLNGVYDTTVASSYEQMGIVMTWIAPGDLSGVDVFGNVVLDPRFPEGLRVPEPLASLYDGRCKQGFVDPVTGATTLCLRGTVTHGSMEASQNHRLCTDNCQPLGESLLEEHLGMDGPLVTDVYIGGFVYGVADFGVIGATGVPRVVKGTELTFHNLDTAAYIWHTITRCKEPCTGPTSASYPIPNGGAPGPGGAIMDFDSSELGIGLAPANQVSWSLTPDETGLFTFFCRIHPGMRGAFRVVDSA